MKRRQTGIPRQWLIVDGRLGEQLWPAVRKLPRGSGVLLLHHDLGSRERQKLLLQLRRSARAKNLRIVDGASGDAARVHNIAELRKALLARTPLVLLSPLHPSASHADWSPLPRMRAAALARLACRRLAALGGMDSKRFSRVQRLGFQAWAGIDAFRT